MSHLRSRFHRAAALAVALAAAAPACSKTPEPPPSTQPERNAPPPGVAPLSGGHPAAPTAAQGGTEVSWDVPSGWETAPNPSPMRKATYKIKKAEGDPEDAELSVSQAGGSVEQNVQRWVGQFEQKPGEEKRTTTRKVGDISVTVVEVGGTFKSGMPGMGPTEPKTNWALLGAIAETPGGVTWFFKLTGPAKTVTAARADFDKLVDSLRIK
ncbi:hypothetical protein [Chondromyces apiculatus]|uniref:Lipoprotein n=1 Tax=Chondromyces apiculatus DSM 436 TaxID=1192034 RepID=A0A017T7U6_9BACT|nr:hypothetical protein [Chondromyces apiculatus]EYF05314.1 Hypothetical protein CAP_3455 [Chondromyces apiculatus DSM 436]